MRPVACLALAALLGFASAPARAAEPSPACRDGAGACRDAFEKLERCQRENPDKPEACGGSRTDADAACKTTASSCDRDGSRQPPRNRPSRKG